MNSRSIVGLSLFASLNGVLLAAAAADPAPTTIPSQPYTWRNVNITAGGFVDGLIFSPVREGLAFARTDIGGAYRWDKRARRWIPQNDWAGGRDGNLLGCESIGVDPVDANRYYLALGTYTGPGNPNGAIVGTADGGKTWHRTDVPFKMGGNEDGRSAGERLAVDPNQDSVLYMGSRNNGLWRSTDYGATWAQVSSFPVTGRTNGIGVVFVLFDRAGSPKGSPTKTLYVGVSQDGPPLYVSNDAGATWNPVQGGPTGLLPLQGYIDSRGVLTATFGNAPGPNGMSGGGVWRLDTHAGTWQDVSPDKGSFGYGGLTVDPRNPDIVMVTTLDRWNPSDTIFRSTDGCAHWTDLGPKTVRDWSLTPYMTFGGESARIGWWMGALALDPFHPGHAMYGTGATIWESEDVNQADSGNPTHWKVGAPGLEETAVICLASPPAGAHLLSGLGDIGGYRHDDLSVSPRSGMWKPVMTNVDCLDFAEDKPDDVVRVGRGGPGAYSLDGAATWSAFITAPANRAGSGTVAISADGAEVVWAPNRQAPYVTHDWGATWQACSGLSGPVAVISDRAQPGVFYAAGGGRIFVSSDGGATFADKGALPDGVGHISAVPGIAGDLWATAGTKGLYHSTDGGATFTSVTSPPEADRLGFGKAAPGQTYPALYVTGMTAAGEGGVFRSDDVGHTWVRINDNNQQYGYSGQVVTGDPRIYGRVYMGTNGRGIFYADPR